MTKKQSYHPIVLIQNHFENLKNKIDLKIGKLLEDNNLNEKRIRLVCESNTAIYNYYAIASITFL